MGGKKLNWSLEGKIIKDCAKNGKLCSTRDEEILSGKGTASNDDDDVCRSRDS